MKPHKVLLLTLLSVVTLLSDLYTADCLYEQYKDFRRQLRRESRELISTGAERISSGPLYDLSSKTAHKCGLWRTPEFYLTHNNAFGARYMPYSTTPFYLRPGKISISVELAGLLSDKNIEAVFAHEIGHEKMNAGWEKRLQPGERRPIEPEIAADRLGAECVGRDAMIDLLKKINYIMTSNPESLPLTPQQKWNLYEIQWSAGPLILEENLKRIEALEKQ